MIKGKVLVLRIAFIIALALVCLLMTACMSREVRAQRIIDGTAELIPIFSEFYEEHEEFFDLLLDIQKRLWEYASEREHIKHFTVRFLPNQEMPPTNSINISFGGQLRYYSFPQDELQLIEMTLQELNEIMQGYYLVAMVREDQVTVRFWTVKNQIYLALASPVMHGFEFGGGRFYMYTRNLNSDWSFHIQTNVRR